MTAPAFADEPPFALDATVTAAKLAELLGVQTELAWLDFKQQCDLSERSEIVELAKDVGAMSIRGGYLVIGVDDDGHPCGLPAGQERYFNEATLSGKLARYLPVGCGIRSAIHDLGVDGSRQQIVLVWVAPHPDGWAVFHTDGSYTNGRGRPHLAFRAGDVYARHGTSSRPWQQVDIADARRRLVANAKENWRAELAEDINRIGLSARSGAAVLTGPSAAFTWQLDAVAFGAAAVELLRRNDDIPVRLMLRSATADVRRLVTDAGVSNPDDLVIALDRIITVAGLGLDLERPLFRRLAVDALLKLYGWAVDDLAVQTSQHRLVPILWLRIAERLYGLGALAVRRSDWATVRELAVARVPALQRAERRATWHRDALTMASRAGLFVEQLPDGQSRELSLLLSARAAVVENPALQPDLPELVAAYTQWEPLLSSLCQFDLLMTVISGVTARVEDTVALLGVSYPNYARADSGRSHEIVDLLVFDPTVRKALVPDAADHDLAVTLHLADVVARRCSQGFWGWEGYTTDVAAFIGDQ